MTYLRMTFLLRSVIKDHFQVFSVCLGLFCAIPSSTLAQSMDTSLRVMYSDPFYYNVIKTPDGEVLAGTSQGIYRIEDDRPEQIDKQKGYLTLTDQGEAVIDPDGIRYHEEKSFSHLFPLLGDAKSTFAAGVDDQLYITSGGRLHIFRIRPFGYSFRNHSIRTISPHFIGTYSGIFSNGQHLEERFPDFCDGYIREWNGKTFVCYSDLLIYEPVRGSAPDTFRQIPRPAGLNFDYCRDVIYSHKAGRYFINTIRQFSQIDAGLKRGDSLFSSKSPKEEVVILGEDTDRSAIVFASGARLLNYSYNAEKISEMSTLPAQILDGHLTRLNYYLLCQDALYVRHADGKMERLAQLQKAHTLRRTGDDQFVIGTDHGLLLYNVSNKRLETLIEGVEFNRRALNVDGGRLFAGSIDGLYTFETKHLEELAKKTTAALQEANHANQHWWFITIIMLLLIMAGGLLLFRFRRRINRLQEALIHSTDQPFTRDDVVRYISDNLPTVSLNAINAHFETNSTQVYTILDPEKPGALIQQMRLDKVMEMRKGGARAREIALITGLSESYIRKIWNKD